MKNTMMTEVKGGDREKVTYDVIHDESADPH